MQAQQGVLVAAFESVLVGVGGIVGFVATQLMLMSHQAPPGVGSWCIVLSLAAYGIALAFGRLHEVLDGQERADPTRGRRREKSISGSMATSIPTKRDLRPS